MPGDLPPRTKMDQAPHRDTFATDNLLSRGQEISVDVDESKAAMLQLAAGEMSLHHVRLIHGSDPNPSDDRRIGFAIRYVPTYVRQVAGSADSATLVRGKDRFGNFELEPRPESDMSPEALAYPRHDHGTLLADPDARHRSRDARLKGRCHDGPPSLREA